MHWRRIINGSLVLQMHGSEVVVTSSFMVKAHSIKAAHVGTPFGVPSLGYPKIVTLIDHQVIRYYLSYIDRSQMAPAITYIRSIELIQ